MTCAVFLYLPAQMSFTCTQNLVTPGKAIRVCLFLPQCNDIKEEQSNNSYFYHQNRTKPPFLLSSENDLMLNWTFSNGKNGNTPIYQAILHAKIHTTFIIRWPDYSNAMLSGNLQRGLVCVKLSVANTQTKPRCKLSTGANCYDYILSTMERASESVDFSWMWSLINVRFVAIIEGHLAFQALYACHE